jgi:hypothetical protein
MTGHQEGPICCSIILFQQWKLESDILPVKSWFHSSNRHRFAMDEMRRVKAMLLGQETCALSKP